MKVTKFINIEYSNISFGHNLLDLFSGSRIDYLIIENKSYNLIILSIAAGGCKAFSLQSSPIENQVNPAPISVVNSSSLKVQYTADFLLTQGIELHPMTQIPMDQIHLHKPFQNNPLPYHNSSLRDIYWPVQ